MIKRIQVMALAAVLCLTGAMAYAQGTGSDWETLNQEVMELYRAGKYDRAIVVAKKALEVAEKRVGPNHPDVATSLHSLASLYYNQGQYAQAETLYRRALTIRENALGPDHPDVATNLNNLAVLYKNQGQYAQAEPLLMRALAIQEKALGPEPSRCGAEPEQPG
jgi:tetratricopeptide (TPR) repeat protein